MKEGTKEKDVMRVVWCRGFKKFLDMKDCNPDNCEYHAGIQSAKAGGNEYVMCSIPQMELIKTVCEVK